jgi:hypothetical protein
VPAYVAPDDPAWGVLSAAPAGIGAVIVNPDSGPGTSKSPDLARRVNALRRARILTLGYVATDFGSRPLALARAQMARYERWYGVDGFLFDEAATDAAALPYYRRLRVAAGRRQVVLNPGAVPAPGYRSVSDAIVTFEGTEAQYRAARFPPWTRSFRTASTVYEVPPSHLAGVVALARARGARLLYVTDARLPNPYDRLPSYYARERGLLAAGR